MRQLEHLSSPKAIRDTIRLDWHVFAWFSSLIYNKNIADTLRNEPAAGKVYENLDRAIRRQSFTYGAMLSLLILVFVSKQWLLLALLIPLGIILINTENTKRAYVSEIGTKLIHQDFTADEIARLTLFQICESYGKKYKIPSLVRKIDGLNVILRNTLIVTFLLTVFIYPLQFLESAVCVLISFLACVGLFQIKSFYNRIT